MRTYDPFPRAPQSAPTVRAKIAREARYTGYINMPAPNAPRVKHVKKGRKTIKRIVCK